MLFRSAEAGITGAKVSVGTLYYEGKGVKKDFGRAYDYYSQASEEGDSDASFMKAKMELQGMGTESDPAKAIATMTKASEQGNEEAKQLLNELRKAQNTQFIEIDEGS